MKPESEILAECLLALSKAGVIVWRNNSGAAATARGGFVRFGGLPGASDILGVMPDGSGRLLCIEVKTEKGRLSQKQKLFLERMRDAGAVTGVARSAEAALRIVEMASRK